MLSCMLVKLFLLAVLLEFAYSTCPSDWTVAGSDCCSPTFGYNSTLPKIHLSHGQQYPDVLIVWNDSSDLSLAIDTNWITLNIRWGEIKGNRSDPYDPDGIIDIVRVFYQPGKGLNGLQFHTTTGFSPVFGLATDTFVNLNNSGLAFTGWGFITEQSALLQSLSACFATE